MYISETRQHVNHWFEWKTGVKSFLLYMLLWQFTFHPSKKCIARSNPNIITELVCAD